MIAANYVAFVVPVHQMLLILIGRLSVAPLPPPRPNKNKSHAGRSGLDGIHSVGPGRPIQRSGKWLSIVI
jgi:hypothetical protein